MLESKKANYFLIAQFEIIYNFTDITFNGTIKKHSNNAKKKYHLAFFAFDFCSVGSKIYFNTAFIFQK